MKDEKWYVCQCHSLEHFFVISYDQTWNDSVFVNVYLSHLPFFKRFILGIKYIFGYKSRYGNYEEILLDKTQVNDLIQRLQIYSKTMR